jgi:hypothetical protein
LTYSQMIGRRSEILKRNIGKLIIQDNQTGISMQDSHCLQKMIKEYYQNQFELNSCRDN